MKATTDSQRREDIDAFTQSAESKQSGDAAQKLYARGPVGFRRIKSTTWVLVDKGHVRG